MSEPGRRGGDGRRDDRRLLLAGIAGLLGGALLVRRSTVWLAIGTALGLLVGRRLGETQDDRKPGRRE